MSLRALTTTAALSVTVAIALSGYAIGMENRDTLIVTETETATVTAPPMTVEVTRTVRADRDTKRTQVSRPVDVDNKGGSKYHNYARRLVPAGQWPCLRDLWQRESHWNPRAVGAVVDGVRVVGIPQLRGLKATDGWEYQIRRGLTYIDHRYGSPCAAWSAFQSKGWY